MENLRGELDNIWYLRVLAVMKKKKGSLGNLGWRKMKEKLKEEVEL